MKIFKFNVKIEFKKILSLRCDIYIYQYNYRIVKNKKLKIEI